MSVVDKIRKPRRDEEMRMELTEHLGELRSRIVRAIIYLVIAASVCYYKFEPLYKWLFMPMTSAMKMSKMEYKIVFHNIPDAFFVVIQVSLVAGFLLALPFVITELYGFIAPALTKEEKKPLKWVVPSSIFLFFLGVALAYWTAKFAFVWFVDYVRLFPEGVLYQEPKAYVMFMLKLMGIFGLVFQLPVMLMFLAWIGLLRSAVMKKTWRHAILGISVVGLVFTPSNDWFTMAMMIVPVIGLYLISIFLVQIIEKKRDKRLSKL